MAAMQQLDPEVLALTSRCSDGLAQLLLILDDLADGRHVEI